MNAQAEAQNANVVLLRTAAATDWKAAAFFLERSDPERWGQSDRLKVAAKSTNVTVHAPLDHTFSEAVRVHPDGARSQADTLLAILAGTQCAAIDRARDGVDAVQPDVSRGREFEDPFGRS